MLTAYGDMDVSRLDEKPPGRRAIDTRVMPLARLDAVTGAVGRAIEAGRQGLLDLPAGRGVGKGRSRGRHRSPPGTERPVRSASRAGARQDERRRKGRGDGRIRGRRARSAGCHDGHRGRGRCAGGDGDGRSNMPNASGWRNCISCAAGSDAASRNSTCLLLYGAPLARKRQGPARPSCATRGRLSHRRRGSEIARRRRTAGHPAKRPARIPPGRPRLRMANCWRRPATMPA